MKKIVCLLMAAVMLSASFIVQVHGEQTVDVSDDTETSTVQIDENSYEEYSSRYSDVSYGTEFTLTAENITSASSNENGILINDSGYAEWGFNITETSAYILRVKYAAADSASGDIDFALTIDSKEPFSEASVLSLKRLYEQSTDDFEVDASGNDIKPEVTQNMDWQTADLSDSNGYIAHPFIFVFTPGEHKIRFEGVRGTFKVDSITFTSYDEPITYEEYLEECKAKGYTAADAETITIEGEKFISKNSITLLPQSNRTSAATYPQSDKYLKLNTVGGSSWKTVGDAVVWEFNVEKAGMYEIALRYIQNVKDGIFVSRKLTIDNELPFAEAANMRFYYDSDWHCDKLGDDESFSFYLTEGTHQIRLEAVQGDVGDIVSTISNTLKDLNDISRKIVLITGNNIDVNRDYNFDELIPGELEQLAEIGKDMEESVEYINEQAGTSGSYVSIIEKLIFQIEEMTDNPRDIPKHFKKFKSNLGSLGEWLLTAAEQPLEIDRIYIIPQGGETPKAEAGFFTNLMFNIRSFLASYVTDYDSVGGGESENTLKVWIQTGRDQGEIMRELINRDFAKEYNTSVQLQIVTGTLLESVLAGISPDVVLDNLESVPMDYALRNAVVDFTEFSDFEEFAKSFPESTFKPATFNGKVYGIPQTSAFYMFFYRTDIFEEYGYTVPKTWTELCDMIPSLQRNAHEIGIPHDLVMYATLLYQEGGQLYSDDLRSSNINSNLALKKFVDFTEFFTLYDCAVTYNFSNRFRSGEMPCAIALYTEYNQLVAFAPEIKGCWEMVPIPGTVQEDGSINNVSDSTITYIMMMKSSKNKELAWEFIKWYMSDDVQVSFAQQMESILGSCAKVNTANTNALFNMAWTNSERNALLEQMENVTTVPQMPGGYYMTRVITFAFNRVYNYSEDPAETLSDYVEEIDEELERKHKEFGLD